MYTLTCNITINKIVFTLLVGIEITEDVETLTDTCVITIPKKIKWKGTNILEGDVPIKRGDKVSVKLGYDATNTEVFTGYVRDVQAQVPMRITCEDEMFILKTKEVKKQTVTGTLDNMITALVGDAIPVVLTEGDTYLGKYRFTRTTIAQELEEMKREFGLQAFCKGGKLYVCWITPFDTKQFGRFEWGKNIITENLKYTRKEDIRLKVKAISLQGSKDKRIVEELGDKNGEIREVYAYNLNREQLKEFASKELDRLKQTKYEGSIIVFGLPVLHKMDIVRLKAQDGNRGSYGIKKIVRLFGINGYRQEIELGMRLN
jgi:hypothetical protein